MCGTLDKDITSLVSERTREREKGSYHMILRDKRIFLVEDHLQNRIVTQMLLEEQGAKVGFDRWGREAISAMKDFAPIDLIILDLMLPNNISGFDIFDQIRAEPSLARIPVIALSAMQASIAIPQVKAKGFNGFIPKPVEFRHFAAQIKRAVDGEEVWDA